MTDQQIGSIKNRLELEAAQGMFGLIEQLVDRCIELVNNEKKIAEYTFKDQELLKKYLDKGYTQNWGDGYLENEDVVILRKNDDPVGCFHNYVVLSTFHNPIEIYKSPYYSC